ncbi:uncharacterized protein LOC111055098 [Nilaparvata lugens]|uniref:uncharacterized protein LOC111055098 n=1 Tax=Nilaparvata lugens TaxID=108931 RepID=UPI000B99CA59|nr:uncharacterized protein LOC111055098 [Nilaparvata lugens]
MVMADELHLARVFLRDGVKVDVVTLPDNLKIIETTELKFFTVDEQSNIKIISYVGDIVFETTEHPILGKLFSGSYESKINRLFSEEAIVEEGYSYIQLLAYYHIVEGFNKKLSGNGNSSTSNKGVPSAPIPETITYMPKGETKIKVIGSQFSVLHVYDDWDHEMTSTEQDKPNCLQIKWKHGYPTYIPRIVEYVDDRQYDFDAFDLHRTFKVETFLAICQSVENVYLDILQYLNVKQPLNAVMYSGSVKFQEPDSSRNNEYIVVRAFIDMKTNQLVKYDGESFKMDRTKVEDVRSLPPASPLQFHASDQE